jgi:hypothetical protein
MIELTFSMTLRGTYHRVDDPFELRAFCVDLRAHAQPTSELLRRNLLVDGTVWAPGLADGKPLKGQVSVRPEERTTRYTFHFTSDRGNTLRFFGFQDFLVVDLVGSLLRVEGSLYDTSDAEVARASLAYSPRESPLEFLRSLRLGEA